jgi:hypothetical protein
MAMISQILIFLGVIFVIVGGVDYSITGARLPFRTRIKRLALFLILFELSLVALVSIERPNDPIAIASVFIILTCGIGLFVTVEWLKNFRRNNKR